MRVPPSACRKERSPGPGSIRKTATHQMQAMRDSQGRLHHPASACRVPTFGLLQEARIPRRGGMSMTRCMAHVEETAFQWHLWCLY